MKRPSSDARREALRPLASLISKSEKARKKLPPGTWQHKKLRSQLQALKIAALLTKQNKSKTARWTKMELINALHTMTTMIRKVEATQQRFSPGSAHHTLQRNRLKALRFASRLMRSEAASSRATGI